MMDAQQRAEARLHLAMLPLGIILTLAGVAGFLAFAVFAILVPLHHIHAWGWKEIWLIAAAALAVRNLIAGIATMSALDWKQGLLTIGLWGVVVLAYPGWWIG
jgi:hypothetical protein